MLSDIERKMLRIIANYSAGRNRLPDINELCIKTGRTRAGVMEVLQVLTQEEYIRWDRRWPDSIELLETWPRKERYVNGW